CCRPVTSVNKVRNGEQRKCFDRGRNCNQRAGQKLPVITKVRKTPSNNRSKKRLGWPKGKINQTIWKKEEFGHNNWRVLNALFANQRAGKPDAQEPRHGVR